MHHKAFFFFFLMGDIAVLGSHDEQRVFIPPPDSLKGI